MRYRLVILVLLLMGCQDVERPEPPADLISKDKMADIMVDVYLSNAAKSVNNWMLKSNGVLLNRYIYEKHGIDSLQFAESNAFYTSDLAAYNDIFVLVEARLAVIKEEKDTLKARWDREKRLNALKRDSLQKKRQ